MNIIEWSQQLSCHRGTTASNYHHILNYLTAKKIDHDVLHDVLVALSEKPPAYITKSYVVGACIRSFSQNRAFDFRKSNKVWFFETSESPVELDISQTFFESEMKQAGLSEESIQRLESLRSAVNSLDYVKRELYFMYFVEQMTPREIAKKLNSKSSVIRARIVRLKRHLVSQAKTKSLAYLY